MGARAFIYETFTALNFDIYEIFHSEIHKYIQILLKVKDRYRACDLRAVWYAAVTAALVSTG